MKKTSQIDGLKQMIENNERLYFGSQGKKLRVISVVSGKGGVGKSNISTNLAILYGMIGKKVLIMDGDLGLANVNILMGLIPRFTLLDVLNGTKNIKEIIVPFNSNVDLLPGATGFYQMADISKEKQDNIIEAFLSLDVYDIIIIDAGAGISSSIISFINIATDIILVSTPEPTALTDAYGMIKVIASRTNKESAFFIVNMSLGEQEGQSVFQKLNAISHRFLSFNLNSLGSILDDRDLKKAVLQQKPIVLSYPKSKATENLKSIISKLERIDKINVNQSGYTGIGDFFKNLFTFDK